MNNDLAMDLFSASFGEVLQSVRPSVSPSVSQSVSQRGVTDRLTNGFGVGGLLGDLEIAAVLPALVARVVAQPMTTIEPLARYGRIVAVRVVPRVNVDPVLPLVLGAASPGYEYWYARYWQTLENFLSGGLLRSRRKLAQAKRRLLAHVLGLGLDEREVAFFQVWLEHGVLGDYRMEVNAENC